MPGRPMTPQERIVYQAWAQRNLVEPFLESMEKWHQQANPGQRPPRIQPSEAPLPCHPRLTGSEICITPRPGPGGGGPWGRRKPGTAPVKPVPKSLWPKSRLIFK